MLQLNPTIPLETPKGSGVAHFVIDMGDEHDLQWVCVIDATREVWTFRNREVLFARNVTMGRTA